MAISYPGFDQLLERWCEPVYLCCFLLIGRPKAAEAAAFQTFLYLGALPDAQPDPELERQEVLRWTIRTCEDYYYRKGRRRPKREDLEKTVPFPVTDPLWHILCLPLEKRMVFSLHYCLGCSLEEVAGLMKISARRIEKLARIAGPYTVENLKESVSLVKAAPGWTDVLADDIYLRFQERSVSVENRLLNFRSVMDRTVPWLALLIIILFAAAAIYTANLGV